MLLVVVAVLVRQRVGAAFFYRVPKEGTRSPVYGDDLEEPVQERAVVVAEQVPEDETAIVLGSQQDALQRKIQAADL